MTPEAMRRLADLKIEKQFGLRAGDGRPRELAAPLLAETPAGAQAGTPDSAAALAGAAPRESDQDFERRTTAGSGIRSGSDADASHEGAVGADTDPKGPLEAIALYERLLAEYPSYENSDKVLYQMARAYDELGRTEEAMATMERLIRANPHSEHSAEVQFRRGEYSFTRRKYRDAETAYSAVIGLGVHSESYELALYKLGWTFYKQDLYEEALQRYVALLDYKVSIGYDFDKTHDENDDRRVADTFRVISLSFSNLGGPQAIRDLFSTLGSRSYEDRVYSNLGEHYLSKLRYDDAAKTFKAFVALYPFHHAAPHFSMRVIETFTQGGFPKLVLESKREFASQYGLKAEYWRHFKPEESPEVLAYLKANLKDLATHYHAQYQSKEKEDEKTANYREALRWYGESLQSFPTDAEPPPIHYRLADLLLEHKDFGEAAKQYERTAYEYAPHAQSAAAGYAAVYAYREELKVADTKQRDAVAREMITSSIKFADTFPQHEKASVVLGAAADDLYEMKDYGAAVAAAKRVIETYPAAEYDAGAALIRLKDWTAAAGVLDAFRSANPEHPLHLEATRQIALAYRESGQVPRAAGEYERFSSEAKDPAVRREALLVAGDLYQQSHAPDRALDVYGRYVKEFPKPVETVLEIRFKIAEIHKAAHDDALYRRELTEIVRIDADAGPERTARSRTFAGRAALVLAERVCQEFADVKLRQPFESSLQEKKQRMDAAIEAMDRLGPAE